MNQYELQKLKDSIKSRTQRIKETHISLNQSAFKLKKLMPEPSVAEILQKYPELLACINELIELVEQATQME